MHKVLNIVIVLLVVDLLAAGGLFFGWMTLQDMKAKEVELRQELAVEEQKASTLVTMRRTLETVKEDHAALSPYLYDATDESQIKFLSEVEGLGTSTTGAVVEARSIELTKESKEEPQVIRGNFNFSGTWDESYHLLRLLEEFPANVFITRFEARKGDRADWVGTVVVNLVSLRVKK